MTCCVFNTFKSRLIRTGLLVNLYFLAHDAGSVSRAGLSRDTDIPLGVHKPLVVYTRRHFHYLALLADETTVLISLVNDSCLRWHIHFPLLCEV